jgi:hypothetical protein
MSYCRFGPDSDVYVYASLGDEWICCACALNEATESWERFATPAEMIAHLKKHKGAGHMVPEYAIERLQGEGSTP